MIALGPNAFVVATIFGWELVIVSAITLILWGARRLPEMAKGFGDGLSQFHKALDSQAHDAGKSLGGIHGKPAAEALTPDNQTAELYDPGVFQEANSNRRREPGNVFRRWRTWCRWAWDSVRRWLKGRQ